MNGLTLDQLKIMGVNAMKAGDNDAAAKIAAVIKREQSTKTPTETALDQLDAADPNVGAPLVQETIQRAPDPSLIDNVRGGADAAATLATAATGGLVGQVAGTIEGVASELAGGTFGSMEAADRIEKLALERADQLTRTPATERGAEILQNVGEVLEPLAALPPIAEAQVLATQAGKAGRQAQGVISEQAKRAAQTKPVQAVRDRFKKPDSDITEEPVIQSGAAGEPASQRNINVSTGETTAPRTITQERAAKAQELGFTGDRGLMTAQETGSFADQQFMREMAKREDIGDPIRERMANQTEQFGVLADKFIASRGAQTESLGDLGAFVDKALKTTYKKEKDKVNVLYKDAEKAGEMQQPVELNTLIDHLNESTSSEGVAPNLRAIKNEAVRLGAAVKNEDGTLTPASITLNDAEKIRQFINESTDDLSKPQVRQAAITKQKYDLDTESAAGEKFQKARKARAKLGRDFERIGTVKNLLGLKRGTDDRAIALEDVLNKSILTPSTSKDSVLKLRRLLQTKGGDEGRQAWRELQAGTLRHIKNEMFRGQSQDERGNSNISIAGLDRVISGLDKNGKLTVIFGKEGAEKLRTVNDVAKVLMLAPAGSVNNSNTGSIVAGILDLSLSATTGIPAPIATAIKIGTGRAKDAKLKARVKKLLGE